MVSAACFSGGGDPEDAPAAVGLNDQGQEQVAVELLAVAEELVEERLDRRQAHDVLAFHNPCMISGLRRSAGSGYGGLEV